jgi:ribA/ribD-fused uncharacterized protein
VLALIKMKYSKKSLDKTFQSGKKMKFLFFWGHKKDASGEITSSCFSQWWSQKFTIDGIEYPTAEHYMMAEKARLFNDKIAEEKILNSNSPGSAKKIGREVLGFNQSVWEDNRMKIVIKGNFEKFNQNPELKKYLLNTKKRILAESSPVDKIWGIGLDKTSEFAPIPVKCRGLNLLGFALMEVRDMLNE